ncbi:MAG: hypothetical protein R3B45_15530 [Bdellovibrionota bacterium]
MSMYFKTFSRVLGFCATFIICSWQNYAIAETNAFDFEKINASLSLALEEFSAQSDAIESFQYSFNAEHTNIDQDRYFLDLSLALPKAPWSEGRLDADGSLGFYTDIASTSEPGFTVAIDATYKTDALAMLKYKVINISQCNLNPRANNIMGILWKRHCEYVAKLVKINSVDALYDLLKEKLATHKADVIAYKKELKKALNQLAGQHSDKSNKVSALLSGELAKTKGVLKFISGVILKPTKQGFKIKAPAFDGCPILGSTGLQLSVTPHKVHIAGDLHVKFGKSLYAASRPVILEILRGLENNDPFALKFIKLDAEVFTNLVTNMLDHAQGQQR